MKENLFIFDVDGTLTPSRKKINPIFEMFLIKFSQTHPCVLVTGSDYDKTIEQIGITLANSVQAIYNCNGYIKTSKDQIEYEINWDCPNSLYDLLQVFLQNSKWEQKFGNHIENRRSMINFSTIGRNCPQEQRDLYFKWDNEFKERQYIADIINTVYKNDDVIAKIGGQISIDIGSKENTKSFILNDLNTEKYNLVFFGDRTEETGNDYDLYNAIITNKLGNAYKVTCWQDTHNILKTY